MQQLLSRQERRALAKQVGKPFEPITHYVGCGDRAQRVYNKQKVDGIETITKGFKRLPGVNPIHMCAN